MIEVAYVNDFDGKVEFVDSVVTKVSAKGIDVKTYYGRVYKGCSPRCVKRI